MWQISSLLELSGAYQLNLIRFTDRDKRINAHIVRLRAILMVSTKLSISSFIQYNSTAHNLGANVRLRYNPREGNDLFLVYNEGLNFKRHREVPVLPVTENRTIMLKYTYTFQL